MSVRESERDQSSIEFLKVLMDIEKWTIRKTNICPKKFRFIVNTQLLTHAANAYSFAKMGNSVRVHDYESKLLREKYIMKAYVSIQAYASQIDVIYAVCKSDIMTNNELKEISQNAFNALKLLNGVYKADKERYKGYMP